MSGGGRPWGQEPAAGLGPQEYSPGMHLHADRTTGGEVTAPLTVLLVEDHASFRQALEAVVEMEDDLCVVAAVARGEDAGQVAAAHRPDVAIIDLDLPGADGIEAIAGVRRGSPATSCVVLTGLQDDVEMGRAVEAGVAAVLHKSVDMDELLGVIRRVGRGATLLPPSDVSRWLRAAGASRERNWSSALLERSLTRREREVLALLAQGGTNRSIAAALHISPGTVQTHVRNLMAKLDERSRLEAVTTAIRLGLVDPPS